jgi:iron complex outermembrane receptor protein
MASISRSPDFTPLAAAALLALAGTARAQDAPSAPAVQSVQVIGHGTADAASVTGFSQALSRTPIQVDVIDAKTLADIGATSLSDLTRLDASLTDSYNAVGYWTTFTLRGFQIDNRYNFRRDGLPINAETVLPLDNKSDIEILKGLSGMQAGTSAPGGLVNLVVKRPDVDLRDAQLTWSQNGTVGAALDLSQRFGDNRAFGARLGVSADRLDPNVRDAKGHRQVLSLATDWRIDSDHLLELEFEHNLQSQPSVPGFSMLGDVVPDPHGIDPHINLNDQPWSLPVVTQGNTMSLRYTQKLGEHWSFKVHALQQQLVSNDHLAFDYGYAGCDVAPATCDRFAGNGTYSIYDFRSDDERRQTRDLDLSLSGDFATGSLRHALTAGALLTRFTGRFDDEAYNYVGEGSIDGQTIVPSDPSLTSPNTDRNERTTELYLRDAVQFGAGWTAWAGVRHTRLARSSWPTSTGDPATATAYTQSFTTPWLSVSKQLTEQDMVYVSWGEGVQSDVAPNEPLVYVNAGQVLPSTISKQWEAGYKHGSASESWGVTAYDIQQPQEIDATTSTPSATNPASTLFRRALSGDIRSIGVEADARTRVGALTLRASAMWQRVRNQGQDAASAGPVPVNVPMRAVKLAASYAISQIPGLSVLANMAYEGGREVLPDDSAQIPGWTRFDLGARYTQQLAGTTLVWRGGVDNIGNRRAWREAPYQYGHAYLFPLEPRTFRASVAASF